jgi:hypothetical protein
MILDTGFTSYEYGMSGKWLELLKEISPGVTRAPAVYYERFYVAGGGLISYGADTLDPHRRAASYVDRILKGEKPSDLPVQALLGSIFRPYGIKRRLGGRGRRKRREYCAAPPVASGELRRLLSSTPFQSSPGECQFNRLGGIHGGKKNAPDDSGAITFSGTFSGTLVGARSGAGAGV